MAAKGEIRAADVRRLWRGYPMTAAAVLATIDAGWSVRASGKGKPRAYCPCGHGGPSFTINWTPQNDGNQASRIRNNLAKTCPDQHDLIK